MTTDEIKAIIAEMIAGQGNQVDIGGALAEILNAIVDRNSISVVKSPTSISTGEYIQDAEKAAELRDALFLEQDGKIFMRTLNSQLATRANEIYGDYFDEPYHYMALFTYGVQYLTPGEDIDAYCMVAVYFNLAGDAFAIIYTEA